MNTPPSPAVRASRLNRRLALSLIAWRLRLRFPEVPEMTRDALERRLGTSAAPVLLDVRTAAEFEVSHLPCARRVEPASEHLPDLPRDAEIVVYCSVGYRSARLADRLRRLGYTNVFNLRGGVFAWANAGRPLASRTGPVHRVHPFDAVWGRLLDPARRAPVHN